MQENVSVCLQLMENSLIETRPTLQRGKQIMEIMESQTPQSPVGVIDAAACGSCESQRSSTTSTPTAKRRRLDETLYTCTMDDKNKNFQND